MTINPQMGSNRIISDFFLYSSEIGSGWKPAVLSTLDEYNFIRIGPKSFINSDYYWLGGSTNINWPYVLEFSNYIANNSGITLDRL